MVSAYISSLCFGSILYFELGMNSFASRGDTEHKLRFAFNIYDMGKRRDARKYSLKEKKEK